ncbi:MAG: hypothetical protein AAF799_29665 [Myxococcota bacterium]
MTIKLASIATLASTGALLLLGSPGTASAARQAVCEHPEGSVCVAKNDTGRIECQCLDGDYEVREPSITGSTEEELLEACWEAWTASCAPWKLEASCDESGLGSCEVSADGTVACACEHGSIVELEEVDAVQGLGSTDLPGACEEQIELQCPAGPPPTNEEPDSAPFYEDTAKAGACAFDPDAPTPWLLGLLLAAGAIRRRRALRA